MYMITILSNFLSGRPTYQTLKVLFSKRTVAKATHALGAARPEPRNSSLCPAGNGRSYVGVNLTRRLA